MLIICNRCLRNIIPDKIKNFVLSYNRKLANMAEGGSENDTLGKFVKKHSKYGTTTKSTYTNDKFIKYTVEKGDTLQGISLKQGVTVNIVFDTFVKLQNLALFFMKIYHIVMCKKV